MPKWDAEIEVDEVLARQLIRRRYPERTAALIATTATLLILYGLVALATGPL